MLDRIDGQAGTEPRPSLGIGHLTILRGGEMSLLCRSDGDIDSDADPSAGLFFRDMRYVSKLQIRLGNARLTLLDTHDRGFWLTTTLTNPDLRDEKGALVESQSIVVRREQVLRHGIAASLQVTNHGRRVLQTELKVNFAADFEDIFVIRGIERRTPRRPVRADTTEARVTFSYRGLDEVDRSLAVIFSEAPSQLTTESASFALNLEPGDSFSTRVILSVDGHPVPPSVEAWRAEGKAERAVWGERAGRFESSNSSLNHLYDRALDDLFSLRSTRRDHKFLAAGVPWFDAPFGRDSLITGMALLRVHSEPLRDALVMLAAEQATTLDPARDAAPGKIAHELRVGELANIGEVPFGRYYGSIDSTPLFVIALREYLRWTGDKATVLPLLPAALRAIEWCLDEASGHPRGALSYHRSGKDGLEHQGWKDSWDGVCHRDGAPVAPPVALIEVQAYLACALSAYQELSDLLGSSCPRRINEVFDRTMTLLADHYLKLDDCPLAYDGVWNPVTVAASNPGHVLWAGACSQRQADSITARLMAPDLFSGWGIRTLNSGARAYNPLGYHVGSVWPHENALILEGFRRYGLLDHVQALGSALLEAMLGFSDGRVPELFSGDARDDRAFPTPYPTASRPQAWSAASLPWTLGSLLGVCANDPESLHITTPLLPTWLDWARLRGVRFGETTVDLFFRRDGIHVGIEVERHEGPGSIVLSRSWPIGPLG